MGRHGAEMLGVTQPTAASKLQMSCRNTNDYEVWVTRRHQDSTWVPACLRVTECTSRSRLPTSPAAINVRPFKLHIASILLMKPVIIYAER